MEKEKYIQNTCARSSQLEGNEKMETKNGIGTLWSKIRKKFYACFLRDNVFCVSLFGENKCSLLNYHISDLANINYKPVEVSSDVNLQRSIAGSLVSDAPLIFLGSPRL